MSLRVSLAACVFPLACGGAASTPAAAIPREAAPSPVPVACLHPGGIEGMCGEALATTATSAADAKARCARSGGEPRDGSCPSEAILASCTVSAQHAKVVLYETHRRTSAELRGALRGVTQRCAAQGGKVETSAALTSMTVSCTTENVCTEAVLVPATDAERKAAFETCAEGPGGKPGVCSRTGVISSCGWVDEEGRARAAYYAADPKTKPIDVARSVKVLCDKRGGVYNPHAAK